MATGIPVNCITDPGSGLIPMWCRWSYCKYRSNIIIRRRSISSLGGSTNPHIGSNSLATFGSHTIANGDIMSGNGMNVLHRPILNPATTLLTVTTVTRIAVHMSAQINKQSIWNIQIIRANILRSAKMATQTRPIRVAHLNHLKHGATQRLTTIAVNRHHPFNQPQEPNGLAPNVAFQSINQIQVEHHRPPITWLNHRQS